MNLHIFIALLTSIETSIQASYLPILEALNITNPYYIVENFHVKNILKHHFTKSEFSMVCKSVKDIPKIYKEEIYSVIQITKSVDNNLLDSLLEFHFPTFVLIITNSSQKSKLEKINTLINQQMEFYFDDTQELYEAYLINDLNIVRKLGTVYQEDFE